MKGLSELDLLGLSVGDRFDVHIPDPQDQQTIMIMHIEILSIDQGKTYRPVKAMVTAHSIQKVISVQTAYLDKCVAVGSQLCLYTHHVKGSLFVQLPISRLEICGRGNEDLHFDPCLIAHDADALDPSV